jgi:hypothetical protein
MASLAVPVTSVKKGFKSAVGLAVLPGKVTPHTLRYTAATWLMQRGGSVWEAAGFLGMSAEVLLGTYGHHHPDFLHDAANAITSKHQVTVVETIMSVILRAPNLFICLRRPALIACASSMRPLYAVVRSG